MVPSAGVTDHFTPVVEVPVTCAVKVCCAGPLKSTIPGCTATEMGDEPISTIVAVATWAGFTISVAVTVTFRLWLEGLGTVYTAWVGVVESVPTLGESDHVTPCDPAPLTVKIGWLLVTVVLAGLRDGDAANPEETDRKKTQ